MCTSFAVYGKESIIYGMNFDTEEIDLKLKIKSYKDKNIFYLAGLLDHRYRDIAGINSDGLFICTQAVENRPGSKPSRNENDWSAFDIFDEALKKTQDTTGFLELLNKRVIMFPRNPLFPDFGLHTIIADKTSNAVILEEGIDTNIISRSHNDFTIMTNFLNGDFNGTDYSKVYGCGADRYICAYEYINQNIHHFGVNEAFEILRKTSREDTLCTIVYEPLRNEIYIRFKKDASKKWLISIDDRTIQLMDGVLGNDKIQFTNEEIFVNDLF